MPYFSQDTIFNAINQLSNIKYIGGKQGNIDTLPIYLFLSKLGINDDTWIDSTKLYSNKDLGQKIIYELGGCFDLETEEVETQWCFFFTRFSEANKQFYNPKSNFNQMFSRVKDTIDNSISDHLLDKGKEKNYRLKNVFVKNILNMYEQKYPLDALIIWLYRSYEFAEENVNIKQIREYFYQDYKINYDLAKTLFNLQESIILKFNQEKTKAEVYRQYLNIDKLVKFTKKQDKSSNINQAYKIQLASDSTYLNNYMKFDQNKLYNLLEKHKQLILTGVPGTGKSFVIDQLSTKYQETVKIQFHQNYSYQDFVIGKTIKNNSVEYVEGILIQLLRKIQQNKKNKDKHKYLLVIDEINRGNISAIFGELLYALDRDKTINIRLGDSGDTYPIFIPENLHIVGTMNTADRSIALVDFAIRRRFLFVEMQPDYELIDQLYTFNNQHLLGDFLQKINNNIKNYFNTEDYQIGHSYFIKSLDTKDKIYNWTSEDLYEIIQYKIIPMLVEYAHGDKSVIPNILGKKIYLTSPSELEESIKEFLNEDTKD